MTTLHTTRRIYFVLLAMLLAVPVFCGRSSAENSPLLMELASKTIQITTFYNGTTLEVTGSIPEDADVAIQVSGPKHDVHLKEKGKVAGFLWMNKTDVSLENTPAVYMLYTPAGATKTLTSPELGIGYKALLKDIEISPESEDKTFIFQEYVKLMEKSGVYALNENSITYGTPNKGVKGFAVTLTVPSKMSAGDYTVEAIAVENGKELDRTQENVTLELTGLPKTIASLAYGSPLLFGFMAVFIAIATGLLIGMIFRGGGGAH